MIHRLRFLLVLLAALLATLAHAGSYQISCQGGTAVDGNGTSSSYSGGPDGQYNFGAYGGAANGAGGSCSGPISTVVNWVPDPGSSSDPHPAKVLVDLTSTASFSVYGFADDGFGDPVVYEGTEDDDGYGTSGLYPGPDYESETPIHHFSIVSDSSGSFPLPPVSPFAYGIYFSSGCSVGITVRLNYAFSDAYVTVTVPAPKVVGLAFNATTHRQEANFTVNASITKTDGSAFPAGTTFSYSWSEPNGVLTFQNTNGTTTSNRSRRPPSWSGRAWRTRPAPSSPPSTG